MGFPTSAPTFASFEVKLFRFPSERIKLFTLSSLLSFGKTSFHVPRKMRTVQIQIPIATILPDITAVQGVDKGLFSTLLLFPY